MVVVFCRLGGSFLPLSIKDMELYERLVEIFEIPTVNIDKANRRTLLRYAKRVQFQKRREVFYSVCPEGKKSKVAICKSDERPQWVHNLDTLKTKALRQQLKAFLQELGMFIDPKKANLKKLAKAKNWEAVVHLDDSKTGGALRDRLRHSMRFQSTLPEDPTAPRARRILRGGMPSGGGDRYGTPASGRSRARVRRNTELDDLRGSSQEAGFSRSVSRDPESDQEAYQPSLHYRDEQDQQEQLDARAGRLRTKDKLRSRVRTLEKEKIQDRERRRDARIEDLERQVEKDRLKPLGGGGGDGRDKIRVIAGGTNCYFMDTEESCACPKYKLKPAQMTVGTKRKLKKLAEQKQLTCAKIDLLRCLTVEFEAQAKMWRKFKDNCQGDYLAPITAETVKELTCKDKACFDGSDLHTLKGVAQCYNLSQNLCKGFKDSMERFSKKAIGEDYTLGHLCYDELVSNVRKFGDPWSNAAYRRRIPDPPPERVMICEKPGGPEIINIPEHSTPSIAKTLPGGTAPAETGLSSGTQVNVRPTMAQEAGLRMRGGGPGGGVPGGVGPRGPPGPPGPGSNNPIILPPRPVPPPQQTVPFLHAATHASAYKTGPRTPPALHSSELARGEDHKKPDCQDMMKILNFYQFRTRSQRPAAAELAKFNKIVFDLHQRLATYDHNVGQFVKYYLARLKRQKIEDGKFTHLQKTLWVACTQNRYYGFHDDVQPSNDICIYMEQILDYAQARVCEVNVWDTLFGIVQGFWDNSTLEMSRKQALKDQLGTLQKDFRLSQRTFRRLKDTLAAMCRGRSTMNVCEHLDFLLQVAQMGEGSPALWVEYDGLIAQFLQNALAHPDRYSAMSMERYRRSIELLHRGPIHDGDFEFLRQQVQDLCKGREFPDTGGPKPPGTTGKNHQSRPLRSNPSNPSRSNRGKLSLSLSTGRSTPGWRPLLQSALWCQRVQLRTTRSWAPPLFLQ